MALLRFGVLDAEVYPDKVDVIIDLLWTATRHASPLVRCSFNVTCTPMEAAMLHLSFPCKRTRC